MAFKGKSRVEQVEFIGYVNITLTEEAKEEYKAWKEKLKNIWDLVDEYVENSYRVSTSYDKMNNAFMCSITSNDPKNDNAGYVMVGRGSDSYSAVCQAIYKDRVIAQNRWREWSSASRVDWD